MRATLPREATTPERPTNASARLLARSPLLTTRISRDLEANVGVEWPAAPRFGPVLAQLALQPPLERRAGSVLELGALLEHPGPVHPWELITKVNAYYMEKKRDGIIGIPDKLRKCPSEPLAASLQNVSHEAMMRPASALSIQHHGLRLV
ncbi:hypothetical protein ABZP36_018483 [Zizania latifolia]